MREMSCGILVGGGKEKGNGFAVLSTSTIQAPSIHPITEAEK